MGLGVWSAGFGFGGGVWILGLGRVVGMRTR